jgi:hypothetical protein
MASQADNIELPQASPWDIGQSDQTPQAIAGFHKAVAMGIMTPEEGVSRLKKAGVLKADTTVTDLMPGYKGAGGENSADHERATPFDKLGDTNFQGGPMMSQSNLKSSNPNKSDMMTPTMNQPGLPSSWLGGGSGNVGRQPAQEWEGYDMPYGGGMGVLGMPQTVHLNEKKNEKDTSNQNKHVVSSQVFDPEQNRLRMLTAMGYDIPRAKSEFGEESVDAYGRPQYDLAAARPNPLSPVQQQLSQVNRLQDLLKMQNDVEAKAPLSNNINLAPLLNLASKQKAWGTTEGSLLPGYQPPENPQQQSSRLMAAQQGLMRDRADIQKGIYENMRTSNPTQTFMDTLAQAFGNKNTEADKDVINPANRMQGAQDERDKRQIVQNIQKNPELQRTLAGVNTLRLGLNLLNSPELNPQLLREAQVQIRTGLQMASGSRTGVDERAGTYLTDLGIDAQTIRQALVSDISRLDPRDPVVQHFRNVSNDALGKMNTLWHQQLAAASEGHESVLERHPEYRDDIARLLAAKGKIGQGVVAPTPKAARKAPVLPGGQTQVGGVQLKKNADGTFTRVQ